MQVLAVCPDLEDVGEGGHAAGALAQALLPAAVAAWEGALAAAFTAGAEERRRAKDTLAKVMDHIIILLWVMYRMWRTNSMVEGTMY